MKDSGASAIGPPPAIEALRRLVRGVLPVLTAEETSSERATWSEATPELASVMLLRSIEVSWLQALAASPVSGSAHGNRLVEGGDAQVALHLVVDRHRPRTRGDRVGEVELAALAQVVGRVGRRDLVGRLPVKAGADRRAGGKDGAIAAIDGHERAGRGAARIVQVDGLAGSRRTDDTQRLGERQHDRCHHGSGGCLA